MPGRFRGALDLAFRPSGAMLEGVHKPEPPPLPLDWPFAPRSGARPLQDLGPGSLPGLGEGWHRMGLAEVESLGLESEPLSGRFGRGGVRRSGDIVLRPYRRGGLVRHFNGRRYAGPDRFAQELRVHEALWRAGFPTPEPLGYAWRAAPGWGVEGVFLTRFVAGQPWPRDWSRSPAVLAAMGPALGALCAWGLWSPDLNATNVHLGEDGRVLFLDWDRAAWGVGEGLGERYRERLERSLVKLGAPSSVRTGLAETAW